MCVVCMCLLWGVYHVGYMVCLGCRMCVIFTATALYPVYTPGSQGPAALACLVTLPWLPLSDDRCRPS